MMISRALCVLMSLRSVLLHHDLTISEYVHGRGTAGSRELCCSELTRRLHLELLTLFQPPCHVV